MKRLAELARRLLPVLVISSSLGVVGEAAAQQPTPRCERPDMEFAGPNRPPLERVETSKTVTVDADGSVRLNGEKVDALKLQERMPTQIWLTVDSDGNGHWAAAQASIEEIGRRLQPLSVRAPQPTVYVVSLRSGEAFERYAADLINLACRAGFQRIETAKPRPRP